VCAFIFIETLLAPYMEAFMHLPEHHITLNPAGLCTNHNWNENGFKKIQIQ